MFTLQNLFTKNKIIIEAKYNNEELMFNISALITKRNIAKKNAGDELNAETYFELVNAYLEYKGDAFKSELFNRLSKAHKDIEEMLYSPSSDSYINPIADAPIFHSIIDIFSMEDIFYFLKNVYRLPPPSNLDDSFDVQVERDGRGSRVQTYTKDDYLELVSLGIIMKVVMCPIYNYAVYKLTNDTGSQHNEYILFHIIKSHPIYETPPMKKLLGFVSKLIDQNVTMSATEDGNEVSKKLVLEKQLPKDEIPIYMLAIVVIQKLAIANFVDDNADRSIVTKIYNFINNKLKSSSDTNNSIRHKKTIKDQEVGPSDGESLVESYRASQDISNGTIIELNWSVDSIDKIIRQLPIEQKKIIDPVLLERSKEFCKPLLNADIKTCQVTMLSIIFKSIIDPRALDYINIESILNLFTVAFPYLWGSEDKQLAVLLCSMANPTAVTEDVMHINTTTNKSRLTNELREELDFYFPYKKSAGDGSYVNMAENTITEISSELFNNQWIPLAPEEFIVEAYGSSNLNSLVPAETRILLAEFIVKNEKRI